MRPASDWGSAGVQALTADLAASPPVAWEFPVDEHYDEWVRQHRIAWAGQACAAPAIPKQTYLTPHTLELVHERKAYRSCLVLESQELKRRRKLMVLAAFLHNVSGTAFTAHQLDRLSDWFAQLDVSLARAAYRLRLTGKIVRSAVKKDRIAYLQG